MNTNAETFASFLRNLFIRVRSRPFAVQTTVVSRMNVYLRFRNAPVPCEVDADALNHWLTRALQPANPATVSAYLPKRGKAVVVDAMISQKMLKAIMAFAMEDDQEDDPIQTLAASRLLLACRNPPFTISVE